MLGCLGLSGHQPCRSLLSFASLGRHGLTRSSSSVMRQRPRAAEGGGAYGGLRPASGPGTWPARHTSLHHC